ncbi:ATPase [Pseudomonas veronii]|uniref:BCAM0308 family protein n=1 Tax=Pseudomonas veronii TaxID=76761 RepID=UPI0015A08A46|nr:BCAM0308 family protein [Pseudomonas veronii]NWD57756.1 ATPase [Pseudomonas veronii]
MDKYQQSQKNKLFKTSPHDPYCLPRVEGSAVCPQCDAVYQAGNWTWNRPENAVVHDAQTVTCPACRRIADNMPAGTLMLSGGFLQKHHDEIIHLIENTEKTEMAEHALERIMRVTEVADDLMVTTTGIHLANRLAHALEGAFKGKAQYRYGDSQYGVNVTWARNE